MSAARDRSAAELFFALGDPTRLSVVRKLGTAKALSASALSEGAPVTRQAIVKHLRVLEGAGLVTHEKVGREVLFLLNPARLDESREWLDLVTTRWDQALDRLKTFVENDEDGNP